MVDIILAVVGTLWMLLWFLIYFKSRNSYKEQIESLDSKEYFMKELYHMGFYLLDIIGIDKNGSFVQKKMMKLSGMYGRKVALALIFSDLAAQITFAVTFFPFGLLFGVIAGDVLISVLISMTVVFLVIYIDYDKSNKIAKRQEEIRMEFPHVLSQMALLINAGMPLREVIEVSSRDREGLLAKELQILTDDMKNGIPEYEALKNFSDRCGTDEVRKLATLIIQNVRKGSTELAQVLMELSNQIWRERVNAVKQQGEKASTKLLAPILIIFGGIILMVVVPMFSGMSL